MVGLGELTRHIPPPVMEKWLLRRNNKSPLEEV